MVVDNASTDGAPDMVSASFPRVRLIRNGTNAGFARGCNQAAAVARGRYLFFLNNDTILPPGALRQLVQAARTLPRVGLLGPRLRDASGRIQCSARTPPTVPALLHRISFLRWTGLFRSAYRRCRGRGGDPDQVRAVPVLMGAALLIRRRFFRQLGGWSESFTFGGEDIDLCTRVVQAGRDVVFYPKVEILHLGRLSSRQHTGFATGHTLVGITRSLRCTGTRPLALALFKAAFLADLPLRMGLLAARCLLSRLRGNSGHHDRARKELAGLAYFTRHLLVDFCRA